MKDKFLFYLPCYVVFIIFMFFTHDTCYAMPQNFNLIKGPHRGFLGPEIYYLKRKKAGGSRQNGWLYGGRAVYERLKREQGWYWALDGYYACGHQNGSTRSGKHLKSKLSEKEIEGRLGYSLFLPQWASLQVTPYTGYGYFYSKNNFVPPSPLPCTFHNRFHYAAAGFLGLVHLTPCLEAGIDFQAKFMVEGKSIVTNDPDYDKVTLLMKNKTQYEVNLPVRYQMPWQHFELLVCLIPFYRFRHYGGKSNYPFDFIDTKFHIYGGKFIVNLCF